MPDWTYFTFLRPVVARLPRRFLRAWGSSRVGARVVHFMALAPVDRRIGALAGPDTEGIARQLGVGFTRRREPGAVGVADPADAVRALRERGEVVLDIAKGGPGLPKRVHEAVTPPVRGERRWGLLLLGLGMLAAGIGAWVVAATRVVLPYDERFVSIPEEMLPFLSHDRMTLAGTMISIGVLYTALAWSAPGAPWVRRTIGISAALGFANFFLFLAYGYFDPLHAAISATLFPFFLWGMWRSGGGTDHAGAHDVRNDRAWRLSLWGTLGIVSLGVGLVLGGLAIAYVGSTKVFVASDLVFLGDVTMSDRLVALAAHDRAGFGGALVSNGALVALIGLWGIRRGTPWLWWAMLVAGLIGFGSAIGTHVAVGYTDAWHLAPVVLGLAVFLPSMAALRPYMAS